MVLLRLECCNKAFTHVRIVLITGSGKNLGSGIFRVDGLGQVAVPGVYSAFNGGNNGREERKEDDEEEDQLNIFLDECEVTECGTQEGNTGAPQESAENIEGEEHAVAEARHTRHHRGIRSYDGDEAADDDGNGTVFFEESVCLYQVFFFKDGIVFVGAERFPAFPADPVGALIAEYRY